MKPIALVFCLILTVPTQANLNTNVDLPAFDSKALKDVLNGLMPYHSIGLRYGTPSSKQILPVNTKELYLQRRLSPVSGTLLLPKLEVSVSQLNVGQDRGYIWGVGPAAAIPLTDSGKHIFLTGHAKVHYLTRHHYGRKRYGGNMQWTYGFGLQSHISFNAFISYMWVHMSNADHYDVNPALETHTMALGVYF